MGVGPLASGPHHPGLRGKCPGRIVMIKKIVDRHDVRASALKIAAATYRREPSIVELASRRPKPFRIEKFEKLKPIRDYLRTCKSKDYVSGQALEDLFKDAKLYVDERERYSVADLYERR